jgi:hypothetical protein
VQRRLSWTALYFDVQVFGTPPAAGRFTIA